MNIIYMIIFFILGTCMGSFYTVVGESLPEKKPFLTRRSECPSCKHILHLWDMVPILSYLFLGKKCRYCKKKIDGLSTYMEFFTGILFALSFYRFGMSYNLWISFGIISLLIILSVSDIKYYIIPDEVLIFFSGYFIIINALSEGVMIALLHIVYGLILFGFMYAILLLGNFIFKKETLGGGDIKLMFVFGQVINPFLGIIVIFCASFLALPISLIILWKKKQNLIPFGPFLMVSFLLIFFLQLDMTSIIEWIKSI